MSRFMSGLLPGQNMRWRLVGVFAILLAMLLPSSTAIAAGPTRFTTTANIELIPGSAVIQVAPDQFTVSDLIFGCIASSSWSAIPDEGQACDPNPAEQQPSIIIQQTSDVTVRSNGRISGQVSGSLYVNGFRWNYDGRVTAKYDPAYGFNQMGFPNRINKIEERGNWSGTDGTQTASATFKLVISYQAGDYPTMSGQAVFTGSHD